VREWLWLALVSRRLGDPANHRYNLKCAVGRMYTIRHSSLATHGPSPNQDPPGDHRFSLASELSDRSLACRSDNLWRIAKSNPELDQRARIGSQPARCLSLIVACRGGITAATRRARLYRPPHKHDRMRSMGSSPEPERNAARREAKTRGQALSRPRSESRQRTALVAVRLLPQERDVLAETARLRGITLSEFIRASAIRSASMPATEAEALLQPGHGSTTTQPQAARVPARGG